MVIDVDYLVLGSGIAGLTFALKVNGSGTVAIITKKSDTESNTNYAQGGIAGVLSPDDSYDLHIRDTLIAGAGLCHKDSVEILVREGPQRIRELIDLGVRFTYEKSSDGAKRLALGMEGGHSRRRIAHAADLTGREIERALIAQSKSKSNIRVFEHDIALDLIVESASDGRKICRGAYVLDTETGDVSTFRAGVTMLATGGLCKVYKHTTNPDIATGDGVAMAFRAGARIANLEFIQFHPTSLYHPDAKSFLISEAVRGEGGVLRTKDGNTFMEKYHEMGCLAPRDIVARAIDSELKKRGDECVFLDITHLEPERIKTRFPHIYQNCLKYGIDMTKDWIPIVPAAHYSCGGVLTDINARTSVENLYACGEVACTGVHGANRLASNSLLEAVVFGHRAAINAIEVAKEPKPVVQEYTLNANPTQPDHEKISELTDKLRSVMWKNVGIVRSNERLKTALEQVNEILKEAEKMYADNYLSADLIELRNLSIVASLIIQSSLLRKESRGLNYNIDYPETDDEHCLHDTIIERNGKSIEPCVVAAEPCTCG